MGLMLRQLMAVRHRSMASIQCAEVLRRRDDVGWTRVSAAHDALKSASVVAIAVAAADTSSAGIFAAINSRDNRRVRLACRRGRHDARMSWHLRRQAAVEIGSSTRAAVRRFIFSRSDAARPTAAARARGRAAAGRDTLLGVPATALMMMMVMMTSNSAAIAHRLARSAYRARAEDDVEKRIERRVSERHQFGHRQNRVESDSVVRIDPHQTDDKVRRPADNEADDHRHGHLDDLALRRDGESSGRSRA